MFNLYKPSRLSKKSMAVSQIGGASSAALQNEDAVGSEGEAS